MDEDVNHERKTDQSHQTVGTHKRMVLFSRPSPNEGYVFHFQEAYYIAISIYQKKKLHTQGEREGEILSLEYDYSSASKAFSISSSLY